jgi:hypothetical protein
VVRGSSRSSADKFCDISEKPPEAWVDRSRTPDGSDGELETALVMSAGRHFSLDEHV